MSYLCQKCKAMGVTNFISEIKLVKNPLILKSGADVGYSELLSGFSVKTNDMPQMQTISVVFCILSFFLYNLQTIISYQGPKLTFLGRCHMQKMWSPERVNIIFPSQRNTNRWKILVANCSFKNQNEEKVFGTFSANE